MSDQKNQVQTIADLVKKGLAGFNVVEMTEVFRVDEDGHHVESLGFYKDPTVAKALAGDSSFRETSQSYVLTNGNVGFILQEDDSVAIMDDEKAKADVQRMILEKLTPEQREILGFKH